MNSHYLPRHVRQLRHRHIEKVFMIFSLAPTAKEKRRLAPFMLRALDLDPQRYVGPRTNPPSVTKPSAERADYAKSFAEYLLAQPEVDATLMVVCSKLMHKYFTPGRVRLYRRLFEKRANDESGEDAKQWQLVAQRLRTDRPDAFNRNSRCDSLRAT